MKRDGVSISLDLVLEEIAAVEAQLIHEGQAAFQNSHYEDAKRITEAGMRLQGFSKKLAALKEEWTSGIDIKTRERVKVDPEYSVHLHTKGPKKNLRITMPNGRVVQRPTAAAALMDAIEMLGAEQVRALDLRVSGVPLVGTKHHAKYTQKSLGKWLVCTHSNTVIKKTLLERIGKELNQAIQVEVIPA